MVRTQIQLSEDQARRLKEVAAQRGVSMADLVRQAVDGLLQQETSPSRAELVERAIVASGRHRSGRQDVAGHHDDYLSEAFKP